MSNSSALPIGQIALNSRFPERAIGTHWWNPPQLIPVVEVIQGPRTSPQVMQQTTAFLIQLGKQPVRVGRDVPGFIGNRLQHALWREAIGLVSEGIDAATVDRVIAATLGCSLAQCGPIAQMQRLGADRVARLFEHALPLINNERAPARLLRDKVAAGQLGAKSGHGFLSWPPGAYERAAARLQRHVETRLRHEGADASAMAATAASDEAAPFATRPCVALWREALALIADGVCAPADVDLMACSTIGLRLAAMAPIENADYVGLDLTLAIHEVILPTLSVSTAVPAYPNGLQ